MKNSIYGMRFGFISTILPPLLASKSQYSPIIHSIFSDSLYFYPEVKYSHLRKTTMKIFYKSFRIFLILTALATLECNAQSYKKGQLDINLGLGVGNTFIDAGSTTMFPAFSASVEYGITRDISLGGYFGIAGATYKYYGWEDNPHYGQYNYTDTYNWMYFIAGVRGAYHFARLIPVDKLDVYAGLMVGNDFAHETYTTTSNNPDHVPYVERSYGGVVASLFAGARYRFTDHFGVFGELGYGITVLTAGVNFKF
jgi:hypothetical protein